MRRLPALLTLLVATAAQAQSPQETARRLMEESIAKQRQAVAAMQIAIAKQADALRSSHSDSAPGAPGTGVAVSFFTLSWPAMGSPCEPLPEDQLAPLIEQAARKEAVDPNLVRAVARQESGFRSCALSPKGAMGLMQLMPATARELGVHDPFDPAENLLSGAHLLKQLLARFGGNTALALGAYNAGPARVEEDGGVPPIPETTEYVQRILSNLPLP